jgi:cytoskeletal protein RodZ
MKHLGIDLKSAREKQKLSLSQIAADTRISLRHLSNLEQGNYSQLPGGMYNRVFLRAYGDYLGLDGDSLLQRYKTETAAPEDTESKIPPGSSRSLREASRLHPMLTWSIALALTVAGLFISRNWISSVFSPYVASHPSTSVTSDAQPGSLSGDQPAISQFEPSAALRQAEGSLEAQNLQAPVSTGNPAFADIEYSVGALHLRFEVVDSCWISLSSDGEPTFVKLLKPGESRTFAADDRFYVIIGNAAGVNLMINGRPVKPLGKSGEVVRMLINEQNMRNLIKDKSMG